MRLCVLCAGRGKACCLGRDILVSEGDIERIARAVGTSDFFELRRPGSRDYLDQDDDPVWNEYTIWPDGTRRVLKHSGPGICVFLTPGGCAIPVDARPLVCRLHPVEYTEKGLAGVSSECPVELLEAGESLLQNLEMDSATAEHWRAQLYAELKTEHDRDRRPRRAA